MPASVPYDPALVLGDIVDADTLAELQRVEAKQRPIDQARDHLNALVRAKMALAMTQQELVNLGAEFEGLEAEIASIDAKIAGAAAALTKAVIEAEK